MHHSDLLLIGTFGKVFGTTDLVLNLAVDFYEEYTKTGFVFVEIDKIQVPFHFTKNGVKQKGNKSMLLSFIEVRSEKAALNLVGKKVFVTETDSPDEADELSNFDQLINYSVHDQSIGFCGVISDYINIPSNPLIEITLNNEIYYIPAVSEFIVAISDDEKRMDVQLPEGLLGINLG